MTNSTEIHFAIPRDEAEALAWELRNFMMGTRYLMPYSTQLLEALTLVLTLEDGEGLT